MTEVITSTSNAKIKHLVALSEKSSLRREEGVFVLEGRREIERAVAKGYEVVSLFVCPEIIRHWDAKPEGSYLSDSDRADETQRRRDWTKDKQVFEVSKTVYNKIAYRGSTEGIIAIVKEKHLTLADLSLKENPLIVVLESVEKPGNLGAVLRSADAVGIDALIVCNPLVDQYNPNVLRASTGTIFSVPTVFCSSEEAISFLQKRDIKIFTAQLQDSSLYYDCDFTGATAIVFGTEATGLSDTWRKAADKHIRIPMNGIADSLNVSVSAAVLMYEALRQRS